jgi:predicted nucleic acid-binding protein
VDSEIRPVTALDTSVVVPGLLSWHEQHKLASAALIEAMESPAELVLPLHTLVEAFSVMTRLPPPFRVRVSDALAMLEGSFRGRATLVGLDGDEGWDLIGDLSRRSIAGGTSYDGLILACARKGGAQRLLTFNGKHFERFESTGIEILVPGSSNAQAEP